MTPFCTLSLTLSLGAIPPGNEIAHQDAAATIAALHNYELHHGRDNWTWQFLQKARAEVYDPLFGQNSFPAWLDTLYDFALRWFLVLELVAIAGGAFIAWRLWCRRSTWRALLWSFIWLVFLFLLYWLIAPRNEQLVVIKTDATILRQGNGLSYPPHFYQGLPIRLAVGVEATVRAKRNNGWIQVVLSPSPQPSPSGGEGRMIGWVPSDSVYFIK
jgi:hypothetical protein